MHLTMSQKLLPVIHVIRVHVWSSTGIHCLEIDNWITLQQHPPPFCNTPLAGADFLGHILVLIVLAFYLIRFILKIFKAIHLYESYVKH